MLKNTVTGRISLRAFFIEGRQSIIEIRYQLRVNDAIKTFLQKTTSILLHLDQLLPKAVSVSDNHVFIHGKLELEHPVEKNETRNSVFIGLELVEVCCLCA